ncbi:uncharacterized protein [Aegilops tauschii subsp. strangulata]|uniref:uncharacterized protein isoform X1 n=1 Tax=Aegilops tauschii subsp. strangulata TaxID=200361 RepID=UPI003CC8D82A
MAAPSPPPPPLDPQLQPMVEGSAASRLEQEHHHLGTGDEPSFRMDDLPAEILPVIISLLPLKEAVRTSIVSTSWKMLWTFHCNLCFYGPNELDDDPSVPPLESDEEAAVDEYVKTSQAKLKIKRDKFIEAVNCVIQRHSGVGINKFSIRCGLHKEEFDHLDRWISFAASSKAKIISFDLKKIVCPSKEVHQFPLEALVVQGSSCVQSLYLADASLKPHPGICGFTLLRRLVLEFVEIFGDFSGFLANCSALEDLELIECSGVTNLSILHQLDKLQHLLIDRMPVETVESNATDLAHFEYKGKEIPIVLHGRSKLEKATIMFEGSNGLARVFTAVPIILGVKALNVQAQISAYEQLQKLAPRPCCMFIYPSPASRALQSALFFRAGAGRALWCSSSPPMHMRCSMKCPSHTKLSPLEARPPSSIFSEICLGLAVRHVPSPSSPPSIARADLVADTTVEVCEPEIPTDPIVERLNLVEEENNYLRGKNKKN